MFCTRTILPSRHERTYASLGRKVVTSETSLGTTGTGEDTSCASALGSPHGLTRTSNLDCLENREERDEKFLAPRLPSRRGFSRPGPVVTSSMWDHPPTCPSARPPTDAQWTTKTSGSNCYLVYGGGGRPPVRRPRPRHGSVDDRRPLEEGSLDPITETTLHHSVVSAVVFKGQ